MLCCDCLQGDRWHDRGIELGSTRMLAHLLWKMGSEVRYLATAVCDADFGRARHVSCTWLAVCCLHK